MIAPAHDLDHRLIYIADGWVDLDYEDIATVRLEKGSMAYQPPTIRAAEVGQSDGAVIVEVVMSKDVLNDR